jgi:hypothetical protein
MKGLVSRGDQPFLFCSMEFETMPPFESKKNENQGTSLNSLAPRDPPPLLTSSPDKEPVTALNTHPFTFLTSLSADFQTAPFTETNWLFQRSKC